MYHRQGPSAPLVCGTAMLMVAALCSPGSEFQLLRGEVTVLMAGCAERSDTLKEKLVWGNKPWGRAWVENWTSPKEFLSWTVTNPVKGQFQVEPLIAGKAGTRVDLTSEACMQFTLGAGEWQRIQAQGILTLPAGRSTITLRLREGADSIGTAPVKVKSLELVNLADRPDFDRPIRSSKAPTAWLRDAGYGLMFQWGEWSYPKHGLKKPWPRMVEDFDVEPFAGSGVNRIKF